MWIACMVSSPAQPVLSSSPVFTAISEAWSSIQDAYVLLQDAFSATGTMPQSVIDQLNQAITDVSMAEDVARSNSTLAQALAQQATSIADQAKLDIYKAKEEGMAAKQNGMIILGAFVAGTLAAALLVYRYGSGVLWTLWLRMRKDDVVQVQASGMAGVQVKPALAQNQKKAQKEAKDNGKKKSKEDEPDDGDNDNEEGEDDDGKTVVTMETISSIIAIILVVIAVAAVSQVFLAGRQGEQFSELGILGPNQMIGDYPKEVVAGDTINLFAYVGNHMGEPKWFSVLVKIGDSSSTVDPASGEAVFRADKILSNGMNWTYPVELKLTAPGLNQRIVFELWAFNETSRAFSYTERWGHIWLNVTLPP